MNKQLKKHLIANHGYKVDENGVRLEKPKLVRCCNGFECGCEGRLGYKSEDEFYYNTAKTVVELPTVEEFWDDLMIEKITDQKRVDLFCDYFSFIRRPLTLSMFVPVKDGKVLEEPNREDFIFEYHPELEGNPKEYNDEDFEHAENDYQTALNNVLFEGWELLPKSNKFFSYIYKDGNEIPISNSSTEGNPRISDLLPFGLTLKQ